MTSLKTFASRPSRVKWVAGTSVTALMLAMGAAPAGAQVADEPAKAASDKVEAAASAAADDIVVTGSRIARNGSNAPTPVTVVGTTELLGTTPSNIPDALNKLPIFIGGRSPTTINNATFSSVGNFLNLRSFGTIRTLVLLDGRRVPPTAFEGTVDTNTLPQLLVQRVEVVTGGASAVYGSDAITGVVNYVLDKRFTGFKAIAQAGVSDRGDNPSHRIGAAAGFALGDRGHVILSGEYYKSDGIDTKESRAIGRIVYAETGGGTAANPFRLTPNARISTQTYGGVITTGPLAGNQFLPGGVLAPFNPGTATGTGGISSGGDGAYYRNTSLVAALKTIQLFGRGEYELTDGIKLFAQASWAQADNSFQNAHDLRAPTSQNAIVIFSGNAFLPTSVQNVLTATNTDSFRMGRFSTDFGRNFAKSRTTATNATAGLQGEVGDLNWEAFYTYGRGRFHSETRFNPNNPKFYAAVDAVRDGSGNIVCRVTLTNPGLYPGCVPINLFGDGSPSAAARDYVTDTTGFTTVNRLDQFAANIGGPLIEGWAGPISFSVGVEHRRQSLSQVSDVDTSIRPNFTGLRGGFTGSTNLYARAVAGFARGSNKVSEGNVELNIPILRDSAIGHSLQFDGAARYTDYSTSGGVTTWKAGLIYEPVADLRVRYVESRDIRAPTLYDLFASPLLAITGFSDIHTGVAGQVNLLNRGNPDLKPESSRTTTIGVVYRPSWLRGFDVSIDYYKIKINSAISLVGGNSTAAQQACEQSNGTSEICRLFIRPLPFADRSPANYPTTIVSQGFNVGTAITSGVDTEVGYTGRIGKVFGEDSRFSLRFFGSYQPEFKTRTFSGAPLINGAGTGDTGNTLQLAGLAKYRASVMLNLFLGPVDIMTQTRWQSKLRPSGNPALVYADANVPSASFTDLTLQYNVQQGKTKGQLFLSVANLFDKDPYPFVTPTFTGTPGFTFAAAPGYDVVGRSFTAGFRVGF